MRIPLMKRLPTCSDLSTQLENLNAQLDEILIQEMMKCHHLPRDVAVQRVDEMVKREMTNFHLHIVI